MGVDRRQFISPPPLADERQRLLSVCLKALRVGPTLPGRPRSLRRGLKRLHSDAQTGKDAEAKQLHLFAEAAAFEELTAISNA